MSKVAGSSVFANSMANKEEALKMHEQTDRELMKTKKVILLNLLKKIRENPPGFLTNPHVASGNHSQEELDKVIEDLEKVINK